MWIRMFLLGFASKTLVFLQLFGRTWLVQWLFAVIYELYGIILEFFVLQLVQMKGWTRKKNMNCETGYERRDVKRSM